MLHIDLVESHATLRFITSVTVLMVSKMTCYVTSLELGPFDLQNTHKEAWLQEKEQACIRTQVQWLMLQEFWMCHVCAKEAPPTYIY